MSGLRISCTSCGAHRLVDGTYGSCEVCGASGFTFVEEVPDENLVEALMPLRERDFLPVGEPVS